MKDRQEEKNNELSEESVEDLEVENEIEAENLDLMADEVKDLNNDLKECRDLLIRMKAENENQRKRLEREIDNAKNFAIQNFISSLLPAKDSLEKGLDIAYVEDNIDPESLFKGMSSTLKIMDEAFKSAGIEVIDPGGEKFNPEIHEAMTIKKLEGAEPNRILCVYQKGYMLNGRLIRPARVEVSEA